MTDGERKLETRRQKLESRGQKVESRKSKARWRPEGRRYTGEEKRDFSLRRPTHSQERMRKKKVGLLRSK